MDSKSIVSSVIIAVGIAGGLGILGSQIDGAVGRFVDRDRVVTVKGLAEKQVPADRAIWPVSFRELGDDLQEVYQRMNDKTAVIVAFLKAGGIDAKEISVSVPNVDDAQANNYGGNQRRLRYALTQTVTVSTDKVQAVLNLMQKQSELIGKGITLANDYSYRTRFDFTGLNSIKPKMIETATVNAREAAQKFAQDSGSTLGKIRRASQGQFTIYDRDSNTPYIKTVRVVTTVEYFLKD